MDAATRYHPDLVAFVDDDDYVTDDFFEYLIEQWRERPDAGWYVSRCRFEECEVPHQDVWPVADGWYDWFDDMQIKRRFGADAMHVVSFERLGDSRFSSWGRYQREWTLLARLARKGMFYASSRTTKIGRYRADGLTLTKRGIAPDLISCWNYLAKPAAILAARPYRLLAWRHFLKQLTVFPARLSVLMFRAVVRKSRAKV